MNHTAPKSKKEANVGGNNSKLDELDEYQKLMLAMDEEDVLMEEIEKLIENSEDREELNKVIQEKYIPLLEKSKLRTQDAFAAWRKSIANEIKEVENLLNNLDLDE